MVLGEEYMKSVRERVDAQLEELLPKESELPVRLHTAMRYSIFSGSKLIRPVLCIATCEAFGGSLEQALIPSCAIQALHTYTLIHDDLPAMDDDDVRRGKPTCHKQFDEATAVLAGDALLTISFQWLASTGNVQLVEELARATGHIGTIGGQQDDMDYKNSTPSARQLLDMQQKKTANLISVSCKIGAMCAGALQDQVAHAAAFGNNLGMAFQLLDDICDNDAVTMKVLGLEETKKLAKQYENASYEDLANMHGETKQLREVLEYTYASFKV